MKVITAGGETIELGETGATPTIGITDYSRRVTDDFGVTTIVERGFSRRMSVKMGLPFDSVDALHRRLAGLRATPALWVADERFASLMVTGFYKDFDIDLSVPPFSYCTLTVEGLAEAAAPADPGGDPAPDSQVSTMRLLQPAIVTDSVLTASSVAEDDAAEWAVTTTYAKGARVKRGMTHRVYESVADGNLNNNPAGISGKWLDVGPTKRWAMFDQAQGTATSAAGSIAVTLDAGTVEAVALLEVVAATVRVQATGYDRTVPVGPGAITFLDLPQAAGPVTVTIAGPGTVKVGTLLAGRLASLGITEASPTAGITDFSRKSVDDFGEVTVVQRAFTKRMSVRALIRTDAIDVVANRIAAVRARPSLWIGQQGLDSLTVYGFFKDFSIEVGETVSKLSLSIEGLNEAAKVVPIEAEIDWPDIGDPLGTKPDDNATVGAPEGTEVAGRPATQVLLDIDLGADSLLAYTFEGQVLKDYVDDKLYVEGKPVNTVVIDEKFERIEGDSALAQKLSLLGVTNSNGTGFILNLQTVMAGEAATLGQKFGNIDYALSQLNANAVTAAEFDQLSVTVEGQSSNIQHLQQVLVVPGQGAAALVLFQMNVNGHIVGYKMTNDGGTGKIAFTFDSMEILTPSGDRLFLAENGVVKMPNVEIDRLKLNTAVSPVRVTATSTIQGDVSTTENIPAEQTVTRMSGVVNMPAPGWIEIMATCGQGFSDPTGGSSWQVALDVNGVLLPEGRAGGQKPGDSVAILGAYYAASAGNYVVNFRWRGETNVTLLNRAMFIKGFPFTE